MEEEKIENEKKNALLQKQNNLEKLIKLDQKNSSQTLFSKAHRRRLLIRDQALSTTFNWTPNSTEQSLHAFWSHIGQYYFKGLKEEDMERLELLMQGSHLENKTVTPKYTGQASYEAFKSILTSEYKKKLYEDHALSHQNYENLKKKYYLSTVKMAKSMRGLKPSTNPPTFSYDLPALKSAKSKGKAKGFLQEETKQLEGFLTKIESKDDNKADFLDDEIEKFSEEFKKVSKENIRNLTALKNKASKKEKPVLDINDIIGSSRARTPTKEADKWSSSGRKSRDKDHHSGNSHAELKHNFVLYLKEVIIRLENQQAAESIKYVVDCKKPTLTGEKFKFCVIFDEAIRSTESWIEEPILDKLDKMREQSLFKVYKIPQKTYHSINSQNLAGFSFADQKVENRTMELKEKPWKDLIKKGFLDGTKGFTKEELFMKSREFALCHHCKYLFPEEFLVKCTFRSTDLKLPQSNSEYMNSLAFNGNIPKRSIWNNKRTAASFYQKRNGDNVCFRAYCRMCIKQNFDKEIQEESHKPNWICPFCQGVCNCTRCLRYDTLNKLMSLFSILGGDLEAIKEESYSEKYIHGAGSEGPSDKAYKKNSYYALKPTKGSKIGGKDSKEVKGKLDVYKGNLERYQVLKDLRIKLERIRILCSQVARRERMKIRLDSMKNKILEEYIEKARAILDGKSGKRGKPDFDFIDLEPFSLKKVKGSKGALAPTKGKGQVRSNLGDDLIIKRKRGRPRKEETELMRHLEELKSPLKRGRKKKDDLVAKKYIMKTPKSITEKNRDLEKRKMVVKIPARPRGRPRKVDKERELAMAKAEAKAQAKLKAKLKGQEPPRKRGRPPKKKPEEFEGELYEPEFSDEEEEERQEEEDEEDLDRDADEEYGEAMSEEGSEEYDEDEEGSEGERGESGDEEGSEVDEGSGEEYEESGSEEFRESDEDEDEGMRQVKRSPQKPIPKGRILNKKKVGRPPGRPPKRPRGRPPKISPASSPAKPRGRPPLSSPASSPGRPRGRPPLSSPASSPPKPRGRPPLSSPASSPGRPRGRPPKNSPGSSPGRPRGRPPIIRRVLDSDESSGTDEEVYDEEEDEFEDEDVERSGDEEGSEDERGSEDEEGSENEEGSEVEEESGEEYEEDEEDEEEDEEERFKLPRELQGILTHQNADQFDVFTHTLDARRVTRSLYHTKDKGKRGRKKSKKS